MFWWSRGWIGSAGVPHRLFAGKFTSGSWTMMLVTTACAMIGIVEAEDAAPSGPGANRVTVDVYVRSESERCRDLCDYLRKLSRQRGGLDVVLHDVVDDLTARRRLYALARMHRVEKVGLPAVHVLNQFRVGYSNSAVGQKSVASLLSIEVFTRSGCPRCRDAKAFLRDLAERWPALRFNIRDIVSDAAARDRMMKLASHYNVHASSVPAFHLCRQLKIGYLGPATTGRDIETIIRRAARSLPAGQPAPDSPIQFAPKQDVKRSEQTSFRSSVLLPFAFIQMPALPGITDDPVDSFDDLPPEMGFDADQLDDLPELPGNEAGDIGSSDAWPALETREEMEVPFLGRLDAEHLGMPAFTFLVGLVDGFNPCAMWVLMFLLSVLVNIRERKKIIIIAGTFVLVSGLAYFAFMAAWLNVFMLVGLDRPAQVILGCVAIVIGLVNVKDFFAFGKGISFKIPESAKPGIYARVRKIMAAKQLWAALTGAVALAVLVNMVELLCTAGLPAMYTEILILQEYSPAVNYLYLGLYILAYMLDDSVLVAIVVITLSKKKLQEGEGRWLKLLSGVVILALGIVMLVKPDWLV